MKLISLLTLTLIIGCSIACTAQSAVPAATCTAGRTAAPVGSWTWPGKSRVEVFIRIADFSVGAVPSLVRAVEGWDASYLENRSGVRFEYKGAVSEVRTCEGCLTITRGKTSDDRHGAELHAFSTRGDHVIDHAFIVIDPQYESFESLTGIVAHELGHSLGLLDCFDCKRGSTAMGSFSTTVKFLNIRIADLSSGITGPTRCDLIQVGKAYENLKAGRPSTAIAHQAADIGEEPEEDDTPIVVP